MTNLTTKFTPEKNNNIHSGHKERLRQKVTTTFDSLSDHEVLEFILNYSVIRQNMNPVSHNLIRDFGSIANVFDAEVSELMSVDGVGEISAILLNAIPKIIHRYKLSRLAKISKFNTSRDYKEYFDSLFSSNTVEQFYALLLDKSNKIIQLETLAKGDIDHIPVNTKDVVKQIAKHKNCTKVIVAHNHLIGSISPSSSDLIFTQKLGKLLDSLGIELVDHIIVSDTDLVSFVDLNHALK